MLLSQIDKILENKKIAKYLPSEIFYWAKSIILENYKITKNKSAIQRINHKVRHTQEVIVAGLDIIKNSKELNWNKYQAVIICFLHDIGRFEQSATCDTFVDSKQMDHGNLGAKLFKNKGFKIDKKYKCSELEITKAIQLHNKKDFKGSNIYPKLARDADKLALFRSRERLWKNDKKDGYIGKKLNKIITEAFLTNEIIDNKFVKTETDVVLQRTGWMWDLNFKITKKFCKQENIPGYFKQKLNSMNIDPKTLTLIYQKIDKF